MKRFALKTKSDEIVNTTVAENELCAAQNFADLKKISVEVLLSIFKVELYNR